eukprot:CAMPEP_0181092792 /NCGR_PEP_ID=MMETSP1071-20121207/9101_1 /TAXON_ID=35127 /ORGANISM="Thalassiosira sp., Strain NH16" /LENGTH=289 /DNA_ID=CAMNT_0023174983 /DNA_START=434 /DNA_END=1303 /DNA_ORIENTATION=+
MVVLNDIWKRLWYRDYGDVLLQWKVSRQAFGRSLVEFSSQYTNTNEVNYQDNNRWIDEKLSDRLDDMSIKSTSMKYFYFIFAECYIDYVLARKNTIDECYLGLHGHIFDFTDFAEYHPGLIEPILKECGKDATYYFEDIPHSKVARNIACRLCVVVDYAMIYGSNDHRVGLEMVLSNDSTEQNKRIFQSSNTRPLSSAYSITKRKDQWSSHILPRRRYLQRHPTLERMRSQFQRDRLQHEQGNSFGSFLLSISEILFFGPFLTEELSMENTPETQYYDPLQQKWIWWSA